MIKSIQRTCTVLLVLATGIAGCQGQTAVSTPTIEPQVVLTAAAQTAAARLTEMAVLTPSLTPTVSEPTPDLALTAAFSTVAAQLTATASASTPTPAPASATPTTALVTGNERAEFISDVTIPDGTVMAAKAPFKKTWRIKNAGSTTWTSAYALAFVQGEKMGAPDLVKLAEPVAPGALVDITVDMVSPASPGSYRGYWRMVNASGRFFDDSVYVDIRVSGVTVTPGASQTPGTPTITATGGPTPTATATTAPTGLTVSNVTMSIDNNAYSGTCPHTLTFTARFTASAAGLVSYRLEADSSTPGFTFELPAPANISAVTGENVLQFFLEMKNSVNGWVSLHITAPVDINSNQASFTLTCTP